MSNLIKFVLEENNSETPMFCPLVATVKADERGIGIETRPVGGENVGEVFVEVYHGELRAYV